MKWQNVLWLYNKKHNISVFHYARQENQKIVALKLSASLQTSVSDVKVILKDFLLSFVYRWCQGTAFCYHVTQKYFKDTSILLCALVTLHSSIYLTLVSKGGRLLCRSCTGCVNCFCPDWILSVQNALVLTCTFSMKHCTMERYSLFKPKNTGCESWTWIWKPASAKPWSVKLLVRLK